VSEFDPVNFACSEGILMPEHTNLLLYMLNTSTVGIVYVESGCYMEKLRG